METDTYIIKIYKMKILVFDTETTGLPTNKYECKRAKWYKHWGHIVQISWIMYDVDIHCIVEMKDHIIKIPDDIELPQSSVNIHGITREKMNDFGVSFKYILNDFINSLNCCDVIIGHNIEFDINMVRAEMLRMGAVDYFQLINKPIFCTMKENIKYCKILATSYSGRKYYKYPKLMELHKKIYNYIPENLHNSLVDVIVCLRCYLKLEHDIEIKDKSHILTKYLSATH